MKNWLGTKKQIEFEFNPESILIFGQNGVGKTAFIAQHLIKCMSDRHYWRGAMRESHSHVAEWNDGGYKDLTLGNAGHLVFTSIEGGITTRRNKTFDLDISRFGLYHPTQNQNPFLLPYHSVVAVDEAQRVLNSRGGGVSDYKSLLSEIKRHNEITLIAACQRAMLTDQNFRDLFHKIIEVIGMKHVYDRYGRLNRTVWTCHEFENSQSVKLYLNAGKELDPKLGKKTKYSYEGNIFETYDTHACEAAFLDGAEGRNYELIPARSKERTLAAAKGFNKRRFDFKEKEDKKKNG